MMTVDLKNKWLEKVSETLRDHNSYLEMIQSFFSEENLDTEYEDDAHFLEAVFHSDSKSYFTISSKENFNSFITDGDAPSPFIYTPLNDHSRVHMHRGDLVFCYRQGQFGSLDEALRQRGIYGLGIVASEPQVLFPEKQNHEKYGVLVILPFAFAHHLKLREIQLNPSTINLTPYNGNRNDALQYIESSAHVQTLLEMIARCNPNQRSDVEFITGLLLKEDELPSEKWGESHGKRDLPLHKQWILFGAPGTGKSHALEEDCKKYFVNNESDIEKLLIEDIKNTPEKDVEPWFNHLGIKYASFINKVASQETEETLQNRWNIKQNSLWKMKTAAKATIDYNHIVCKTAVDLESRYERVTFHPNYSYAQFVGTYKPVQNPEKGKESEILYKYVEGPFMRTLVKALQHPEQDFLLIIEEINRANVAAVFGDVFQLLDRKNGVSEYPVAASEDIKRYLKDNGIADCNELKIPSNMYIWATMNSADQGVFPMDTAFKRRWEFEYIGVDDNQQTIENFEIPMQKNADGSHEWMKWNELRTKINDKLTDLGINEDKLLGPFFISLEKLQSVDNHNESEAENFVKAFKSKVLMYLFEDAVKMKAPSFFKCDKMRYSEICKKFDTDGIEVFNF